MRVLVGDDDDDDDDDEVDDDDDDDDVNKDEEEDVADVDCNNVDIDDDWEEEDENDDAAAVTELLDKINPLRPQRCRRSYNSEARPTRSSIDALQVSTAAINMFCSLTTPNKDSTGASPCLLLIL